MSESIKINVDVGAGLKIAVREFKDLQTAVKALDYEFRKQNITSSQLKKGLTDVEIASKRLAITQKQNVDLGAQVFQVNARAAVGFNSLGKSLHEVTQASNRSQQGFVALAYIIQDLPYGIRGVANNITQLSQVLGTPIWLNLAISGFTTLAVIMTNMRDVTKEANEAVKDLFGQFTAEKLDIGGLEKFRSRVQGDITYAQGRIDVLPGQVGATTEGVGTEHGKIQSGKGGLTKEYVDATIAAYKVEIAINKEILKDLDAKIAKQKQFNELVDKYGTFIQRKAEKNATGGGSSISPRTRDFWKEGWATDTSDRYGGGRDAREKHVLEMRENAFENNLKKQGEDLREAMQIANSVFFNPMRSAFESIITGSAKMADAFEKAIKQMLASLIANAALAAAISLITGIPFVPIFQGLNGIPASGGGGGFRPPVLPDPLTLKRGFSFGGGSPAIQVYGETRLSGDDILITYRNANSRDIRRNA